MVSTRVEECACPQRRASENQRGGLEIPWMLTQKQNSPCLAQAHGWKLKAFTQALGELTIRDARKAPHALRAVEEHKSELVPPQKGGGASTLEPASGPTSK